MIIERLTMVEIRSFEPSDLSAAGEIALELWGKEVPWIPDRMLGELYEYLARYYYIPESPLNLAAVEDGVLRGLLMAAAPEVIHNSRREAPEEWMAKHLQPGEKEYFDTYRAYLDGNRNMEDAAVKAEEVLLLFFASRQPGCGKLLMQEFQNRSRALQYKSMLLWTDNTCNLDYYYRHNFDEVCASDAEPGLPDLELKTYLFRKSLG